MLDQFCLMRQQTCQRSCEAEIMEAIPPHKKFSGGVPAIKLDFYGSPGEKKKQQVCLLPHLVVKKGKSWILLQQKPGTLR